MPQGSRWSKRRSKQRAEQQLSKELQAAEGEHEHEVLSFDEFDEPSDIQSAAGAGDADTAEAEESEAQPAAESETRAAAETEVQPAGEPAAAPGGSAQTSSSAGPFGSDVRSTRPRGKSIRGPRASSAERQRAAKRTHQPDDD